MVESMVALTRCVTADWDVESLAASSFWSNTEAGY